MTNEWPPTYLLAWNPKNFAWERLDQEIAEVAEKGGVSSWWSTGSVRKIPVGSRVFLIRLGVDPRGILGSGYTTGEVADQEHWQPERRAAGDRMNRVPIRFDVLARVPLIRRAELEGKQFAGYKWDTQMSGVRIPSEVAQELELLWNQRVEGATRGEAPPAILPNDVDRWRTYFQAADADPNTSNGIVSATNDAWR
jgi:5-methylcytosine-specific restriction enzyme A